jgi:hypothetical protein
MLQQFTKEVSLPFTPVRISQCATILLNAEIENVFPLFGPIREMEWADGWNPEVMYGHSEVEEHMIFRTASKYSEEKFYQWVITKYNPEKHEIEYTVSAMDRVWFIKVECREHKQFTLATVTYTYIGLTEAGHIRNRAGMESIFEQNLNDWEDAINHYLKTGEKLKQ